MKNFILGVLSALGIVGAGKLIYEKGRTKGIRGYMKLEEYVSKQNKESE